MILATNPDGFDAVFSDVVMQGTNDVALGREIQRLYPRLPVILTSGYSEILIDDIEHGLALPRKPHAGDDRSRLLRRTGRARSGPRPS
jgi:DNA-binding NtrC family response regulator